MGDVLVSGTKKGNRIWRRNRYIAFVIVSLKAKLCRQQEIEEGKSVKAGQFRLSMLEEKPRKCGERGGRLRGAQRTDQPTLPRVHSEIRKTSGELERALCYWALRRSQTHNNKTGKKSSKPEQRAALTKGPFRFIGRNRGRSKSKS